MADPTIQTFCCHHSNGTDVAVTVMNEFNTEAYNCVCILSSLLGIFGALFQILPRQHLSNQHGLFFGSSATRGRAIIVWLAVSDLLAALGVLARSTAWLSYKNIMPADDDDSSVLFCALSSALVQYFYTATCFWTFIYALDMRLVLSERVPKTATLYHMAAWGLPMVSTSVGLCLLYIPDANCHTTKSIETALAKILPNYLMTYLPMLLVMVANPCLYRQSTTDMEQIITSASGQFTSKERDTLDAIKLKFSIINVVFYICWLPNLVNGILLWTLWFHLPTTWIIVVWYMMAFMNPLQAMLNCMAYRRWSRGRDRIIWPWKPFTAAAAAAAARTRRSNAGHQISSADSSSSPDGAALYDGSGRAEILPLLRHSQNLNGYRNFYNVC